MLNSVLDRFLKASGVKSKEFFKKENKRRNKKPQNDRAKEYIIDSRRVFCHLFKGIPNKTLANYLNTSRSSVMVYRKIANNLIEGKDKKFVKYYESISKNLNLD